MFDVQVKHEKGVRVEWYQDGALVEQDDIRTLSFVDGRCLLKIIECQNRHSGRYVCEAFNSRGKVCTFVRLMVVTDPKIVKANNRLNR